MKNSHQTSTDRPYTTLNHKANDFAITKYSLLISGLFLQIIGNLHLKIYELKNDLNEVVSSKFFNEKKIGLTTAFIGTGFIVTSCIYWKKEAKTKEKFTKEKNEFIEEDNFAREHSTENQSSFSNRISREHNQSLESRGLN